MVATCLASGATLQALLAHALVARWFGQAGKAATVSHEVLRLLVVAGPLTCMVLRPSAFRRCTPSATAGRGKKLLPNWFTWWTGDMFGVLVFMPLVLVLPGERRALIMARSSGARPARHRPDAAGVAAGPDFLCVEFHRGIVARSRARQQFETLATESEQAMNTRLAAYAGATRSGAAAFQSSVYVSRNEWRTFTESLRVREDYPGMLGLGWIERFAWTGKAEYLERVRQDGAPEFPHSSRRARRHVRCDHLHRAGTRQRRRAGPQYRPRTAPARSRRGCRHHAASPPSRGRSMASRKTPPGDSCCCSRCTARVRRSTIPSSGAARCADSCTRLFSRKACWPT